MPMRPDDRHLFRERIDGVELIVHDEHPPTDDEWKEWLSVLRTSGPSFRAVVVYSLGGTPTSRQRRELSQTLNELATRPSTVLISASPLARGVATAVNWLVPSRRAEAYGPDELSAAFGEIRLAPATRDAVTRALEARLEMIRSGRAARAGG